jgi:hypothetical protein
MEKPSKLVEKIGLIFDIEFSIYKLPRLFIESKNAYC